MLCILSLSELGGNPWFGAALDDEQFGTFWGHSNFAGSPEYESAELQSLLDEAFPGTFEGRSFFKQQPHCRLLAFLGSTVIGQVGLDFRAIRVGGEVLEIVGLIDLCVAPEQRRIGVATQLLEDAECDAMGRDFSILMADDHRLYQRAGYGTPNAAFTRQLAIESLESHSIVERDLSDCFMAKPLGGKVWPEGKIDLLGYLF